MVIELDFDWWDDGDRLGYARGYDVCSVSTVVGGIRSARFVKVNIRCLDNHQHTVSRYVFFYQRILFIKIEVYLQLNRLWMDEIKAT